VKEFKKQYQERIANLEEDKKKYRDERDYFKEKLEDEQDRIERSKEIEQKFGKQAARMEEIDYLLDKTEDGLKMIENSFGKVEVDYSDPEALRERVMTLLRRMTLVQEAALTRYNWLEDMDGLSLFPAYKLADSDQLSVNSDQ
jgi:DNA repair exonuclease SbcCD ATPase subunit